MTNHKKQLMSLRVPANSFKAAAPNTMTKEAAPARPLFNFRSFLSAGIKWPRNKKKSEPGVPTDAPGHRHKGSYLSEKMHKLEDGNIEKSDPFPLKAPLPPRSNFQTFWAGLKERFFRFMEVLVLLDSPRELALVLEAFNSKPVFQPKTVGLAVTSVFAFRKEKEEKGRREAASVRITEKITSIAARYRNLGKQPIPVEYRQPAFKMANYGFRIANTRFSPGYS